ncbi:membrane protein FxsA [Paenibacillus sp. CGMCC 1.16610]|uniref:Membrane protein FxsA n=1 Tax=Paenibacillus anseongense TaxID=2682845 RepID=A0ABW9UHM7_9BACL|nr:MULTISPECIES: FxsA family protein [Paenibacillus]MBA2944041.1 membrane protein FxsA [Paenibacillus sp. CGMCC 1.16610]MVQ37930.1 membrane protein FxsA [Paenibacillus anseongense]
MLRIILAIFIIVPAIEISVLIALGHFIGGWTTFGLILLSGFLGIYFAKREGRKVLEYARFEWSQGQLPAQHLLDGICIFLGGILLITPGFITDIFGFLLVFPYTRPIFKVILLALIQRQISKGNIHWINRR